MLYLAPLWTFFVPLLAVATVAYIYRRMFPYEVIKEAMKIAGEYRGLEKEGKDKRTQKRLRSLRPKYLRARRILRSSIITKFILLTLFYIATSMALVRSGVLYPAPAWIPLLSTIVKGHLITNPLVLHLLGYLYALIAFRDFLM